jgi:hypothetical protein
MKAPIRFATRNLLFGRGLDDVSALFRLELTSYEGLSAEQKKGLLADLAAFAYNAHADFDVLRVNRAWSAQEYRAVADQGFDARHGHRRGWTRHLDRTEQALHHRQVTRPEVFVAVRLVDPARDGLDEAAHQAGALLGDPRGTLRAVARTLGFGDPAGIREHELAALADAEARAFDRLADFLPVQRATALDVQWLIRHSFCRGAGEPLLDVHWRPQALVVLDGDQLAYRPHEADLLRLFQHPIEREERYLRVHSEQGPALQAFCALGALPETVEFPGRGAELLFAPLEEVGFAVDAAFCARWVSNQRAAALVRRKVVDADNEAEEQSHGDHGLTPDALRRPGAARALEDYLTASESRPPLLQATISLAVAVSEADGAQELEWRMERLQKAFGTVKLERPLGPGQLALFRQHLPGQGTQLAAYEDYLLVEQLGAMVPTATHAVGSDRGPYLAHTLSGSEHPVCWDITEGCHDGLTPAMLLVGPPGRGKTALLQLLLLLAFLRGSRVIDLDPKPDHRWTQLPEVAAHTELIEFTADSRYRGALDPLRLAPAGEAEDLAVDWLLSLLRRDVPHTWETEVRAAVKERLARAAPATRPTCGDVLEALSAGNLDAQQVARALGVFADSGLAQLGFAQARAPMPPAGTAQVCQLRIAGLVLPEHGSAPEQLSTRERVSHGLLTLAATYGLQLMADDPGVHTVLGLDEAWVLVGTPAGRRLIRRANRLGRAQNGTPLLATQTLGDVDDEIRELVGAVAAFGAETDPEAARHLRALDLDHRDPHLRHTLLRFRQGRCLLRDYRRRVGAVQIDFRPHPELLDALDTNPTGHDAQQAGAAPHGDEEPRAAGASASASAPRGGPGAPAAEKAPLPTPRRRARASRPAASPPEGTASDA